MILKKGFTLIELIMIMVIVGVLAGSGAWLMTNTIQNSVFIPNQLNMDKLASDALNIMVEGNARRNAGGTLLSGTGGLRFAKAISAISPTQLTFENQEGPNGSPNGISVTYRWDTGQNRLFRTVGLIPEAQIPAYSANMPGVTLNGSFTYFDANGAETAVAANVRLIRMILIAQTGNGEYNSWQGSSEQATAIAVKKFK